MNPGERIAVEIIDDPEALAGAVAARIAELIVNRDRQGKRTVLGLATGSTPVGVYRELIRLHREEGLAFRNVVTFNLDEYYPMAPESIHSYRRFMWENFFSQVDLEPEQVHSPRGDVPREKVAEECAAYEAAIRDAGGIDFQLLGIGKTGHIGFNEPGSGLDSRTRLTTPDQITRKDAAADFFGEDNVPHEAITMGVATILEAREIAILATGEHKSAIVRRTVEEAMDRQVAATYLQQHPATTFYVDLAAAADLTRIATPWLLHEIEWTTDMAVRAVVWLSQRAGKAILKLTPADYTEHHLASLMATHGDAGAVNGLAFNALGARIRGRSKLPRGKKIVCFSPHPDDDVISMGGMLRKLVLNGNEIVVAYQTSGNIAVFDHDVRRYMDFLERLAHAGAIERDGVLNLAERVREFLEKKTPGDVDLQEIQEIKRMIRESEAVSGIETLGLERRNARFLNLPFDQTGKVRKDPVGPADVAIVRQLLQEEAPDLIFAAGDLSDPHGTHRMCLEAVTHALDELHPRDSGIRPPVWLYRGAWQEW
jgi:glucosamine-6-phosphate deaminase